MAKRRRRMFTATESAEVVGSLAAGRRTEAGRSSIRPVVGSDLPTSQAAWWHSHHATRLGKMSAMGRKPT